jgi:hypothetical protein
MLIIFLQIPSQQNKNASEIYIYNNICTYYLLNFTFENKSGLKIQKTIFQIIRA